MSSSLNPGPQSLMEKMLSAEEIPSFKFIPTASYYYDQLYMQKYGLGTSYYDDWDFRYNDCPIPKGTITYRCHRCGKTYGHDDVLPVKLIKGGTAFFCENCLVNHVDWCRECGEAFEVDPKNPNEELCSSCRKSGKNNGKRVKSK